MFKNKINELPQVSTASLPDIIFMLLFFFMVVTVLRDYQEQVVVVLPEASELNTLEQKSLVNHIRIGRPIEPEDGLNPRIQLNDKYADVEDIPHFLRNFESSIDEHLRPRIKTSLHVDRQVTMGIIADVKLQLRKSGQLAINYAALPVIE